MPHADLLFSDDDGLDYDSSSGASSLSSSGEEDSDDSAMGYSSSSSASASSSDSDSDELSPRRAARPRRHGGNFPPSALPHIGSLGPDTVPNKELQRLREHVDQREADVPRLGLESDGSAPAALAHGALVPHGAGLVRGGALVGRHTYDDGRHGSVTGSSVPTQYDGVYVDPITGLEYDTYSSQMPAPDADFTASVEGSTATAKLHQFQGGWSQAVPRHARHEVMHHDEHFASDLDPTTYGMMPGRNRREENAKHQLRYNYDGTTPFGVDGRTDTLERPAHMMGSENYAYRFAPYMPPTARDTELTYVATAHQQHGSAAQRTRQVFTTFARNGAQAVPHAVAAGPAGGGAGPDGAVPAQALEAPTATRGLQASDRVGAAGPHAGSGGTRDADPAVEPTLRRTGFLSPTPARLDGSTRHGGAPADLHGAAWNPSSRVGGELSLDGYEVVGGGRVAAAAALHDQIVVPPTRRPALTGVPTGLTRDGAAHAARSGFETFPAPRRNPAALATAAGPDGRAGTGPAVHGDVVAPNRVDARDVADQVETWNVVGSATAHRTRGDVVVPNRADSADVGDLVPGGVSGSAVAATDDRDHTRAPVRRNPAKDMHQHRHAAAGAGAAAAAAVAGPRERAVVTARRLELLRRMRMASCDGDVVAQAPATTRQARVGPTNRNGGRDVQELTAARAHRATHRAEAGISTQQDPRREQRQRSAADVSMRQGLVPSSVDADRLPAQVRPGPRTNADRETARRPGLVGDELPRHGAAPALTTFGSPERVVVA